MAGPARCSSRTGRSIVRLPRLAIATFDKLAADARLGRAEALNQTIRVPQKDTSSPLNAYPAMWGTLYFLGNGGE